MIYFALDWLSWFQEDTNELIRQLPSLYIKVLLLATIVILVPLTYFLLFKEKTKIACRLVAVIFALMNAIFVFFVYYEISYWGMTINDLLINGFYSMVLVDGIYMLFYYKIILNKKLQYLVSGLFYINMAVLLNNFIYVEIIPVNTMMRSSGIMALQ